MFINKFLFFIFSFLIVLCIYWYFMPRKNRRSFLLICSFIFIGFFNPAYALYYLILASIVYIAGLIIKENREFKKPIFIASLILLIGNFCFFKYFQALFEFFSHKSLPAIILPLGLSFITFRFLHYIIELNRNKIQDTSFVDFTLYSIFFPTFLAGPIERFPNFYKQTEGVSSVDYNMVAYGFYRVLLGIIKKFLVADILLTWALPILRDPFSSSRIVVISSVYATMIRLYMDFSGYTDMAIGVSCLFGYRIMENFNRPFLQRNIAMFWRNWHISLYTWIRDYFYFPFFVYRPSAIKMYLGPFLTILVFMLWHGSALNFLVGGIVNGLGIMAWIFFQDLKKRSPKLKGRPQYAIAAPLSIFLTFTYVSFGTVTFFFTRNLEEAKALLFRIFF